MKKSKKGTTPFERLTEFTRRIVAVPRSEIEKGARAYKRKRAVTGKIPDLHSDNRSSRPSSA